MKKVSIAIIRSRYSSFGGAERFIESALASLAARGAELTMITREWRGGNDRSVVICNPFFVGRLWRDWGFASKVKSLLSTQTYSLVQSHERIPGCDVFRAGDGVHAAWLEARRRTQSPLARVISYCSPWHRYILSAEAKMFSDPRLRAVICISRLVADDVRRFFRIEESKLHVIYNGVDIEKFSPQLQLLHRAPTRISLNIPSSAVVFLFVGSGFARKGLRQLLAAASDVMNPQVHLIVLGKESKQQPYQDLARSYGIGDFVHFCGPQHDVRPYYGSADCFVLPTLYEPLSNAVLEALASGLPVLTSNNCGAAELVRNGESGFVCDALDVKAIRTSLLRMLDPEFRERAGKEARASVQHLTFDAMARQYLELYNSLLAEAVDS